MTIEQLALVFPAAFFGAVGVAELLERHGGTPLALAGAAVLGAAALAVLLLLRRSAHRAVIVLGVALALAGAMLISLVLTGRMHAGWAHAVFGSDSMRILRMLVLFGGFDLLVWGGAAAALAAVAGRAARVGSSHATMWRRLAAVPTLLVAVSLVVGLVWDEVDRRHGARDAAPHVATASAA